MLEGLILKPRDTSINWNVLDLDFANIPADSLTFQDKTGKTFTRGGGSASIITDPVRGNVARFIGDGGFETPFPADTFYNAAQVFIEMVFDPASPPTNTSAYHTILEIGAARSPRYQGYLYCFNSVQYETWVVTAGNVTYSRPTINGGVWQKHTIQHNLDSRIRIIRANYDTGAIIDDYNLGTGAAKFTSSGGTTLSIGAGWVAGRRNFLNGYIKSIKIAVINK